jgi:hypothetical protein
MFLVYFIYIYIYIFVGYFIYIIKFCSIWELIMGTPMGLIDSRKLSKNKK